jgi:hypothetical protein
LAGFKTKARQRLENIAIELIDLFAFNIGLWLASLLARHLFGDERVFGSFPLQYVFDAGHVALILCFSVRACISLFRG